MYLAISLDTSELLLPRKADGSLPDIDFLRLKESSEAFRSGMGWEFGEGSGVAPVLNGDDEKDQVYYNLNGVSAKAPFRGMNVIGGKKVML